MIYLDYAATTPISEDVLENMKPYLTGFYGNASSVHSLGRESRMVIERARQNIASSLGVDQGEILFTGSASEANNLVVKGVVEKVRSKFQHLLTVGSRLPEMIVSSIEHPCIMEAVRHVEALGWARVSWLEVNKDGVVDPRTIEEKMNENVVLVSVMFVNNEIGSVQPIKEISAIVNREKKSRKNLELSLPIYFHTDAVQAVQYFDCSPLSTGVDLITLAPHKCYGPKGIGVLYKKSDVLISRQIDGGGQEYYYRAGTENISQIVGAAGAIQNAIESAKKGDERLRLIELRSLLCSGIENLIVDSHLIGNSDTSSPHILNIVVNNCDAEALIAALDRAGFAVSSGSACSSGVVKKSHVIEALGLGYDHYAPLRISLGKDTNHDEIALFIDALPALVHKIRDLGI